eukprot:1144466-Pelagomonas_calceolata.AAC.7
MQDRSTFASGYDCVVLQGGEHWWLNCLLALMLITVGSLVSTSGGKGGAEAGGGGSDSSGGGSKGGRSARSISSSSPSGAVRGAGKGRQPSSMNAARRALGLTLPAKTSTCVHVCVCVRREKEGEEERRTFVTRSFMSNAAEVQDDMAFDLTLLLIIRSPKASFPTAGDQDRAACADIPASHSNGRCAVAVVFGWPPAWGYGFRPLALVRPSKWGIGAVEPGVAAVRDPSFNPFLSLAAAPSIVLAGLLVMRPSHVPMTTKQNY